MNVFSKSDIGRIRKSNQDCCHTGLFSNGDAWAIVCDGVGGANAGDVASATACEQISAVLQADFSDNMTDDAIKSLLISAVNKANAVVYQMAQEHSDLNGMGTTVVAAIVSQNKLHVVHAGDSRAYLLDMDSITQITKDHTLVQQLLDAGNITPHEAEIHPQKNYITRALGVENTLLLDYTNCPFAETSSALICTDGLTKFLSDNAILALSQKYKNDIFVENLVQQANEKGGSDNITVALICH